MAGRVLVLGSGAAEMIPAFNCSCLTCREARLNPRLRRRCSCVYVELDGEGLLIDLGSPEAVSEAGGLGVRDVFLSHEHVDHLAGLNLLKWSPVRVSMHCSKEVMDSYYVGPFRLKATGLVEFKEARPGVKLSTGLRAVPFRLNHSVPTLGVLVENAVAYALDTVGLPDEALELLREAKPQVLLIDTTYGLSSSYVNHNNLAMSIEIARKVEAELTVLTHIAHYAGRPSDLAEAIRDVGGVEVALDGSSYEIH
ncbi:MAG: MBL fold metallo-hydrolase [Candidatus Nezhaarchaeota archaeon]|nr:MBL fold metallo-hydrolase [Candidatus Nezhaarchaeota archaeon]